MEKLNHPLLPKLRRLKLSGILDTLETRAAQASRDQLSPTGFLAILLDDELERREQTRLSRRVTEASVDPTKTLASIDFAAVPELDRNSVADLATAAFVPRAENVILAGPSGVGKSHLVNALVVEALKRGYTGWQRSTHWKLARKDVGSSILPRHRLLRRGGVLRPELSEHGAAPGDAADA